MALTRIDNPTPTAPAALADYVQILAVQMNAILQALRNNSHACIDFTANVARAGVVFYVAGVLYKAVTEQAIGGTPSKYVKIDPSGATASIDYVASLAGVTWSDDQSGYYDGSGNLYVFDEARAVYDGVVSAGKTAAGQLAYVGGALSVKSDLTVGDDATIIGDLEITGILKGTSPRLDIDGPITISSGDLEINRDFNINASLGGASFEAAFTQGQIFSLLDSRLSTTVNSRRQMIGAADLPSGDILILAFAKRVSSTRIDIHGILYGGGVGSASSIAMNSGNATAVGTWRAIT
jgi:hypothetical protein